MTSIVQRLLKNGTVCHYTMAYLELFMKHASQKWQCAIVQLPSTNGLAEIFLV